MYVSNCENNTFRVNRNDPHRPAVRWEEISLDDDMSALVVVATRFESGLNDDQLLDKRFHIFTDTSSPDTAR